MEEIALLISDLLTLPSLALMVSARTLSVELEYALLLHLLVLEPRSLEAPTSAKPTSMQYTTLLPSNTHASLPLLAATIKDHAAQYQLLNAIAPHLELETEHALL